jgi:hypothetical protein
MNGATVAAVGRRFSRGVNANAFSCGPCPKRIGHASCVSNKLYHSKQKAAACASAAWSRGHMLLLLVSLLPAGALTKASAASTLSCKDGHRLGGGDMHVANVTASAASAWCSTNPRCAGFMAPNASCSSTGVLEAHFQDTWGAHRLHADPFWASWTAAPPPPAPPAMQRLLVDLGAPRQPFAHSWKRSFGSGHAKLTRRPDWSQQLALAHQELGLNGVRFHGTYDDDMSVVRPASPSASHAAGTADQPHWAYNFTELDSMWDYLTSLDVDVIVELSFMPCYLANCSWRGINPTAATVCETSGVIRNYAGVTQPPVDFEDWHNLVYATAQHAVERYGLARVRQWKFEVWCVVSQLRPLSRCQLGIP